MVQAAPSSDYEIETRLFFTPTVNFQFAGLLVYSDTNNLMAFGRAFCDPGIPVCDGNAIYFDQVEDGVFTSENYATIVPTRGATYLKLIRSNDIYSGFVSTDGSNWTLIGAHTSSVLNFPNIGLIVGNQMSEEGDTPADFDYFKLEYEAELLFLPLVVKEFGGGPRPTPSAPDGY